MPTVSAAALRAAFALCFLVLAAPFAACESPAPVAPGGPATATCEAPKSTCGANCADLSSDVAHCGSCDNACAENEGCANGVCFPKACGEGAACAAGEVCFEDVCTAQACVGVVCSAGETCAQGQCICDDATLRCGDACVDTRTDPAHCGGCGITCGTAESCVAGACHPNDCPGTDCNALSVCFDQMCLEKTCVGVACPAGLQCKSGLCTCLDGDVSCDGVCVDTQTHEQNCGACGYTCGANEQCAGGQCLPQECGAVTCPPGSVCYLGGCVESVCVGVACPSGKVCTAGACVCPPGKVECDGECASLPENTSHCGTCGNACAANEGCVEGQCVQNQCAFGLTPCVDGCQNTQNDPLNCGQCGDACGAGRNCVNGVCACPQGSTFCNNACVTLQSDPSNCGSCGNSCNGGSCNNGTCTCPTGTAACGGTCIDVLNDEANCGACNNACPAGTECTNGGCACPPGMTLCGGTCTDTQTNNLSCGSCSTVCASGKFCNAGVCQDPFTCQTNFTSAPSCSFFPFNVTSCGGADSTITTPITGSAILNQTATNPFTVGPSERLTLSGMLTSTNNNGQNVRVGMRNATQQLLVSSYFTVDNFGAYYSQSTTGSPYACAHPTEAMVRPEFGTGTVTYNLSLTRQILQNYNLGGTSIPAARQLAVSPSTNLACDQVCGDSKRFCGNEQQYFKVTLPPHKAIVMEAHLATLGSSGTIFYLQAYRANGTFICNVAGNQLAQLTSPKNVMGRLVNNTDVPQEVVLSVAATFGNAGTWNLAVAEEP